ncbi:hypothetical protein [Chryseobacterium taklimakanense]|uniref:Uncharacterized protein n=1 Tax=Chryseobacterium taklimakanense TaxID=536441 RepID=A0A3G8WGU9_9FLAO|nr:hypothetical protein [Chryseobacterium taklimakanense]AZI20422.1 hypothetical protein EIH08_06595 [Chryseobacterium taklimakanense]
MKDKDFRLATDFRIKWEQYCWMKLVIKNVGKSVIENFKLELEFEGDFQEVGAESKNYIISPHFTNTVKEYSNSKDSLYVMAKNTLLVQDDYFTSGNFYIKPIVSGKPNVILLNWKILSKDYTDSGTLTIYIEPKFHVVVIEKEIGNEMEEREEISFHLIERRGMQQFSGINFMDKESDYTFE